MSCFSMNACLCCIATFLGQGPVSSVCAVLLRCDVLQIDVLVDGENEDGWLFGRTQWDAPDVDPIVFLSEPPASAAAGIAPLQVGQMRRCRVSGTSLFDLEAYPVE